MKSENNQGEAETEDDISIGIVEYEARKGTKTDELRFLRYQPDLYRPEPDMRGGGETQKPLFFRRTTAVVACSDVRCLLEVDVMPEKSFLWNRENGA